MKAEDDESDLVRSGPTSRMKSLIWMVFVRLDNLDDIASYLKRCWDAEELISECKGVFVREYLITVL